MPTPEKVESNSKKRRPPAPTIDGRENQLINLAFQAAEKQLIDGSASSQVITHFLKLGTTLAALEKEKLERENALLKVKTDAIQAQETNAIIYKDAIKAMQLYSGHGGDDPYDR